MFSRFGTHRAMVLGFEGAVACSQPLATLAGMRMLLRGGNAIDAAIAAAATLNVVEPMSTGMGGDAFALVYWAKDRQVYALNASGRAPYAATLDAMRARGYLKHMPVAGICTVTVPGAVAGWSDVLARFGSLGLDTVLQPAISYAERGFPVSERIHAWWGRGEEALRAEPEAAGLYLADGHAPRVGQRFVNPTLARSLRLVAEQGPAGFYNGPIAEAIVATSNKRGGLLELKDLADHRSSWVQAIITDYRGYRVHECPPNGQGIAVLIVLNILAGYDLRGMGFESVDAVHLKMEAIRLAMADTGRYVADPEVATVPVAGLLSDSYAVERRGLVHADSTIPYCEGGVPPTSNDTVYLCATDLLGNAVSFINSLYRSFGSGIVAEGTGILLHNRGSLFSLDPSHPNCLAPHKRPYHTIIPGMVTKGDDLAVCFGVMGGFMQPQGQVQVLTNILDHDMNPQEALDAPRFSTQSGREVSLDDYFPEQLYELLSARGHAVSVATGESFGGGHVIMPDPETGAWLCGTEPRHEGCALAL